MPSTSVNDPSRPSNSHGESNISKSSEHAGPSTIIQPNEYFWRKVPLDTPNVEYGNEFSDPPLTLPTPLEYFRMFISNDMFENIQFQTNLYAMQLKSKSINVSVSEMEEFFGILIFMGIFKVPAYRMIWAVESRISLLADVMSRNRFELILQCLHFNDNSNIPGRNSPQYDKLYKIRPLIDKLRENLHKIEPEEYHSIDEQIVPFKGRSGIKQYNKNKPHKWGFKVFTRAGVSGMMYDLEIYTGKGMKLDGHLSMSANVVITLLRNLQKGTNYKIFFDNWFTSLDLVTYLKSEKFWSVGTIRADRLKGCRLDTDAALKKSGRGSHDYRTDSYNGINIVKWYDNKPVHMVSSYAAIQPISIVQRWSKKEDRHIEVNRPNIVSIYNKHMGGVDTADMLLELYRIDFRSRKWYMRLVWYCIDVAVVNGWLLYRRHMTQMADPNYMPLLEFRSNIASALLKAGKVISRKRGRPSFDKVEELKHPLKRNVSVKHPVNDIRYDDMGHWPLHNKKMRCRFCLKGFTRIKCGKCALALCLNGNNNCFYDFHHK